MTGCATAELTMTRPAALVLEGIRPMRLGYVTESGRGLGKMDAKLRCQLAKYH